MVIQVNQEVCNGCGVCIDSCPVEAIRLVGQQAVITDVLCTQCEACISACSNGAITALSIPIRSIPIAALPAAESRMVPAPTQTALPETATPTRILTPLAGAALAFLGKEIAPRLVDVLVTALERKIVQPKTAAIIPSTTSSSVLPARGSGKQRQARYRGGRTGTRNQKGRR
jgi:NAD-dependent dihydropyrimidine dehydrogenase PreA subunit